MSAGRAAADVDGIIRAAALRGIVLSREQARCIQPHLELLTVAEADLERWAAGEVPEGR